MTIMNIEQNQFTRRDYFNAAKLDAWGIIVNREGGSRTAPTINIQGGWRIAPTMIMVATHGAIS
jgi:hypothetical protein